MHKNVRICARCGADETENNPIIEGVCQLCFLKKNSIISLFRQSKIIVCMKCRTYFEYDHWEKFRELEDVVKNKIKIKPQHNFKIIKYEIELAPKIKPKRVLIEITANIEGKKIKQDFEFPIEIDYRICPLCSRAGSDYFEAILQIRPKKKAIKELVDEQIRISEYKITREDELKEGYDYYFVRKGDAFNLLGKIKSAFEGETKNSRTLHGKDRNGKLSYRSTFLFRARD